MSGAFDPNTHKQQPQRRAPSRVSDSIPSLPNLRTPSMGPQLSKSVFIYLRLSSWSMLERSESLDCAQVDLNLRVEPKSSARDLICPSTFWRSVSSAGAASETHKLVPPYFLERTRLKSDVLVLVDTLVPESYTMYLLRSLFLVCSLGARMWYSSVSRHPSDYSCGVTRNAPQLITYSRLTLLYIHTLWMSDARLT